jgi:hypothetical protein
MAKGGYTKKEVSISKVKGQKKGLNKKKNSSFCLCG